MSDAEIFHRVYEISKVRGVIIEDDSESVSDCYFGKTF